MRFSLSGISICKEETGVKLVYPTLAYKEKAIEYINEFYEYGSLFRAASDGNLL